MVSDKPMTRNKNIQLRLERNNKGTVQNKNGNANDNKRSNKDLVVTRS